MFGRGVLGGMMRDPILRRDEHHGRGTLVRRVDAVMTSTSWQLLEPVLTRMQYGGVTDSTDALLVEGYGSTSPGLFDLNFTAVLLGDGFNTLSNRDRHLIHGLVAQMLDIDTERRLLWNRTWALRTGLEDADRGDTSVFPGNLVDARDHLRCCQESIGPSVNWGGATMLRPANDIYHQPSHTLDACHHSDGLFLIFQERTLLDVILKVR